MRGYVEESEEVKASRQLRAAATHFTATKLIGAWTEVEAAEARLLAAALAYAEACRPKRKRKQ